MNSVQRLLAGAAFALACLTATACKNGPSGPFDAGPVDGPTGLVTFAERAPASPGSQPTYRINACFWSGLSASAQAAGVDAGTVANPCPGNVQGGCCVSATDPGVTDDGCVEENLDVGPVDVIVAGTTVGTLHFRQGLYVFELREPLVWKANDALEVKGGGQNGFPTFDVTVGAVAPVTVTAPALPQAGLPLLSRDSALDVRWMPGGASLSDAWVEVTDPQSGNLESVECPQQTDPGRQLIGPAALGQLPAAGLGLVEVWHANRAGAGAIEAESRAVAELPVQTR